MRKEITIVTAFFDIGRSNWQGEMQRSNDKYVEFFQFWARIKNKLIVYTSSEYSQRVMDIRAAYGLADRTQVIVIDDKESLDREVYDLMEKDLANPITQDFRVEKNHPEVYNPVYNYIVYLKFVLLAKTTGDESEMLAWMDFGYNKGGHYYTQAEDFDFLWTVDLSEDKIHLFTLANKEELDELPIFEVVRTLEVYISGEIVVVPRHLMSEFVSLCRRAEIFLADCGFSDDDQTILLMAYRTKPELFELHKMLGWCDQMKLTADKHFTTRKGANVPHKEAKRLAKKNWHDGNHRAALKHYIKYVSLKINGE